MNWATPEERRSLGQSRRKQLRRQQNDQLNIKARKATPHLAASARRARARSRSAEAEASAHGTIALQLLSAALRPVMAADLAVVPNTGIEAQLCGDAHVRNLGAFAAPDGRLVFDINDFDETIRGPFEWDLKRMAASLVLAARESRHKESSAHAGRGAMHPALLRAYARIRKDAAPRSRAIPGASPRQHRTRSQGPAQGGARHSTAHP